MAYKVKRAGRGNWKTTTLTIVSTYRFTVGMRVTVNGVRYRIVGIVGE